MPGNALVCLSRFIKTAFANSNGIKFIGPEIDSVFFLAKSVSSNLIESDFFDPGIQVLPSLFFSQINDFTGIMESVILVFIPI